MPALRKLIALLTLCLALLCPDRARAIDQAALVAALPPETVAVLATPDLPALRRAWVNSPPGVLAADPRAAAFTEPARRAAKRTLARAIVPGRVPAEQIIESLGEPALLAVGLPSGDSDGPMSWVFVAGHTGDPAVLEALRRGPRPARMRVLRRAEPLARGELVHWRLVREEEARIPGGGAGGATIGARRQVVEELDVWIGPDALVVGEGAAYVRAVASALAGNAHGAPRFRMGEGPAWGWADMGRIGALAERRIDGGRILNPAGLGLAALGEAAFQVRLTPGLAQVRAELATPRMVGIVPLLRLAGDRAPVLASRAPGDAQFYAGARVPPGEAWQAGRKLLGTAAPAILATIDALFQSVHQNRRIDLESDLIASLTGEFGRWLAPPAGRSPQAETVWLAGVEDPARFRHGLEALLRQISEGLGLFALEATRGDSRYNYVIRPGRPGTPTTAAPWFHLTLVEGWLVGSRDPVRLATALGQLGNPPATAPLAQRPAWSALDAALPADRRTEVYVEPAAIATALKPPAAVRKAAGGTFKDAPLPIDTRAMPPAALLRERLGAIGLARSVEPGTVVLTLTVTGK